MPTPSTAKTLALVFFALFACARPNPPGSSGVARVVVHALSDADTDNIARITVTVSKGQGSDFTPIVAELAKSGTQWVGRITTIPARPLSQFDERAFEASGAPLY